MASTAPRKTAADGAVRRGGWVGSSRSQVLGLLLGLLVATGCSQGPSLQPSAGPNLQALPHRKALSWVFEREQSRQNFSREQLGQLRTHPSPAVRAAAARAWGRLGNPIDGLLGMTSDPDLGVQLAALEGVYIAAVTRKVASPEELEQVRGETRSALDIGTERVGIYPRDIRTANHGLTEADAALQVMAAKILAEGAVGIWPLREASPQNSAPQHSAPKNSGHERGAIQGATYGHWGRTFAQLAEPMRAAAYRSMLLAGGDRRRNIPGRGHPLHNADAYWRWLAEQACQEQGGALAWWPTYLLAYGGTGGISPRERSLPPESVREELCALSLPMDGDGAADRFRRLFAIRALTSLRPGADDRAALLRNLQSGDPALVAAAIDAASSGFPSGANSESRHSDLTLVAGIAAVALRAGAEDVGAGDFGAGDAGFKDAFDVAALDDSKTDIAGGDPGGHARRAAIAALGKTTGPSLFAGNVLETLLMSRVARSMDQLTRSARAQTSKLHGAPQPAQWPAVSSGEAAAPAGAAGSHPAGGVLLAPDLLIALASVRGELPEAATRWARVHPDYRVRAGLARAARHLAPKAGIDCLSQLALDTDVRVRTATLEALTAFPGETRAGWLASLLAEEQDLAMREVLAPVLLAIGRAMPRPQPTLDLIRAAFDDSPGRPFAESRKLLLDAAATLAAERGMAPPDWLRSAAAGDPDLVVRRAAAAHLDPNDPALQPARLTAPSASLDPGWVTPQLLWLSPGSANLEIPKEAVAPQLMGRRPKVVLHTEAGSIHLELWPEVAPVHSWSLIRLMQSGAYDGRLFHRVVRNFVVQGGDHRDDGVGAKAWHGGFLQDELSSREFGVGALGMPKTASPDTGGDQLFITVVPTPHLDGRYTVFGTVTSGLPVAERIAEGAKITHCEVIFDGP